MSADQRRLSERLRAAFDRAPESDMRPQFRARLTAELRAGAAGMEAPATRGLRRPWMAITAGLLLVVALGAGVQGWLTSGRFAELARLAAGDHQNCAIKFALDEKPISLAEAAIRYDAAFGRLQNVTPASTLSGGPLRVVERHSCVFRGRRFAHIVMAYKGQVVSILVADARAAGREWWKAAAAHERSPVEGFQMASFRSGDHEVFVVSSLPAADVNEIARVMMVPVSAALRGV